MLIKQHRITDPQEIPLGEIEQKIAEGYRVIVQFSELGTYPESILTKLNNLAKIYARQFEIRFYGHYFREFDASVLQALPDACCVSIDCLRKAHNLETIAALTHLKEFSLGVYELQNPDILAMPIMQQLESLSISETAKAHFDLAPLQHCTQLKQLFNAGHAKNITALAMLTQPAIT